MANGMHHTRNSIKEKTRIELCLRLNQTLANLIDLYLQTKQAHWNIKGQGFMSMHKLLDEVAEAVENELDTVAERVTALGGTALGTLQTVGTGTQLRVYPTNIITIPEHLEHLTHNYAILGESVRNDIHETGELGEMATNDVYIELSRLLDKSLWLLEAEIQK